MNLENSNSLNPLKAGQWFGLNYGLLYEALKEPVSIPSRRGNGSDHG